VFRQIAAKDFRQITDIEIIRRLWDLSREAKFRILWGSVKLLLGSARVRGWFRNHLDDSIGDRILRREGNRAMKKRVSILVLTNTGSPAKQFCASRSTLHWAAVLAAVFMGVSVFVGYDYVQLKRASLHLQQREVKLSSMLAGQRDEVDFQRKQIGDFAGEINSLKEKLLALNQFEKKIRVMADVEKRPDAGHGS
jgi:hypothetical protein